MTERERLIELVEMADCASNAAELVEMLRHGYDEEHGTERFTIHHHPTFMEKRAAGAIEQFAKDIDVLTKENAKLKAERDAAVGDLKALHNKYEICAAVPNVHPAEEAGEKG